VGFAPGSARSRGPLSPDGFFHVARFSKDSFSADSFSADSLRADSLRAEGVSADSFSRDGPCNPDYFQGLNVQELACPGP
jgi:hypothetical protein